MDNGERSAAVANAHERRAVDRRAGAPATFDARRDLTRTTFAVLFMVGLIGACFWILRPFIPPLIWATMIVVATWGLMLETQHRLWNRRWIAVIVMTAALILAFIVPFTLAIGTLVSNADEIGGWVRTLRTAELVELPAWITSLPLVGARIAESWAELSTWGPEELTGRLEPYARGIVRWFVVEVGGFGIVALQFLLTIIIAAVLYAYGESAAIAVRLFFRRIAGARGDEVVTLAGQAIRGVALGVVVTALVQSVLGALGLLAAGVPFVGMLTALMFILAVAQIGAVPVLVCAAAWLWWKDSTGWAIALITWSLFVGSMDNVLRPYLIQRGGRLPLLLVFAGVIGGLVAFGLVGIFVGPLVLAVSYRLIEAWVTEEHPDERTN